MNTPTPQTVADKLFNEVGTLDFDQGEALRRFEIRLTNEIRRAPREPRLRVALARVKALIGNRSEALDLLRSAEGLGVIADPTARLNASSLYSSLGEWERGAEVRGRIDPIDSAAYYHVFLCALESGDVAVLRSLVQDVPDPAANWDRDLAKVVAALEQEGILDLLGHHQRIVRSHIREHQCGGSYSLLTVDPGVVSGTFSVHVVDLGIEDALTVSRKVTSDLCDLYESHGKLPGCWIGVFQPDIVPIETLRT